MNKSFSLKINYFFSNLNFIVIFIGYSLITSIFIPLMGNIEGTSRLVTIPFRIFALGITLITLLLNIKNRSKSPITLKLFFLFWLLFLLRMFYDLEISSEYSIPAQFKQQVWLFAIGICFIPMISLWKSISKIDFNLCLKYIYIACNIILIISLFTVIQTTSDNIRLEANIALDSISFGEVAIITTILSLYRFITEKNNSRMVRILYLISALLGLFICLRTGSRGPVLGLIIVIAFWYIFRKDKIFIPALIFPFFISIILIFRNYVLKFIVLISPILAVRIFAMISGNDDSVYAREESYSWFFNKIMEFPLFGSHFARLQNGYFPGYAHNIFLDILLGLGVFGLVLFLYIIIKAIINVRKNIVTKTNYYWIGLIMIMVFILSLTSGAFYADQVLNCAIVLVLILPTKPNSTGFNKFKKNEYNL